MTGAQPFRTYRKADSILRLNGVGDAEARAAARLRAWADARRPDRDPARERLIKAALDDVLGISPAPLFHLRPHTAAEIERLEEDEFARYLHYRYRYDVYPAARLLDDFPPCVQIEPTSTCNYRCVFCYQIDPVFSAPAAGVLGVMPLERFRRIVERIDGAVEAVTLASRGEPLLARELPAMLECMAGRFLAAKLNTNASRLDERLCHALLSANLQTLVISADAADPESYARLRVNGRLDRVLRNVERLRDIQARRYPKSRTIVRVSGVKVEEGQRLEDMQALWGGLADQVAFVDFNPWTDAYNAADNGEIQACSDLWRRLFVWWDGTINPCDVDFRSALAVGDADRDDLSAVWRGPAYEDLRRRHSAGQRGAVSPCRGCAVT